MNTNQHYPGSTPMTNEEYHANTTHISKSGLDLIARSPMHYWAKYLDPNREQEERKDYFVLGSAVHSAILEPQLFEQQYWAVNDAGICSEIGGAKPRATTRYKEWLQLQQSLNAGKEMLSADDYKHCLQMRDAVWKHPAAAALLASGYAEQSFFFNELQTDAPVKIRPDFLNHGIRWIVDVKTTEDASPEAFGKSFFKYGYHKQAAIIMDGMAAIEGEPWEGIAFIAVEKNPPYAVAVYTPTEEVIGLGRTEYSGNLLTYMTCRENNSWPAYGGDVQLVQVPSWINKRIS